MFWLTAVLEAPSFVTLETAWGHPHALSMLAQCYVETLETLLHIQAARGSSRQLFKPL